MQYFVVRVTYFVFYDFVCEKSRILDARILKYVWNSYSRNVDDHERNIITAT